MKKLMLIQMHKNTVFQIVNREMGSHEHILPLLKDGDLGIFEVHVHALVHLQIIS